MRPIPFHLESTLAPPSMKHLLGCDPFGRDLVRVAINASIESIRFALIATLIAAVTGALIGATIATTRSSQKAGALFVLDLVSSIPFILIALALAAVLGPGYTSLGVSLALSTLPSFIRLVYLRSIELQNEGYFTAAVALGSTRVHLVIKHLIPGLFSVILAKTPGLFAQTLLAEAALSFIGVGAPIGSDSLGSLIATGRNYLIEAPQILISGALPLALSVIAMQVLSETIFESNLTQRSG